MSWKSRAPYAPLLISAALVSLVCSSLRAPGAWTLAGVGVLLPLMALTARWSPVRSAVAACAVGGAAVAVWPVPLVLDRGAGLGGWLQAAGAAAFWAAPALGAAGAGAFLRRQADRARRAVLDARRDQQLELARDLHDYVAHDVSAIVVQAQAARFVADSDPRQAVLALERIEAAGLNALASMDRTVHALREGEGGPKAPALGLAHLPELVGRFEGGVLEADAGALAGLSRDADATAYRVAVEALTNVRRHAAGAGTVRVVVRRVGADTELSVANSAPPRTTRTLLGRRTHAGGTGLVGLRERVESADGTLEAGPDEGGGWRVRAVFPAAGRLDG
ncbi:histidine kinase [Streptomyces sp. NPDC006544]|uniref:sensor histidine kinase n=1 Tax=Streptomyces sp. NPDC006544 TaxID=3154583 RepID=UPI0033A5A4DB